MPVLISGVLKDGTGTPVQNCTIQLKACRTSTTVVVNTVASENPDDAGRYSMDVEQGQYTVTLLVEGYPPSHAGVITVYDDSKPGTLNDFLGAMTEDDVRPEALRRFEAMVEEVARQASEASRNATAAGQASEQAQTSAGQAAESATAAVNAAGAAEASATQAASSAASAESSAGTATTKAGEASASAASADTARTAAAASAAAAKTSEANADASRTAAGESAARAEDAAKRAEDIADVISLEDASLTKKGIVKLSSATDIDSEALAATPKAVKAVMSEAQTKAPLDSPAFTGTPTTPTPPDDAKGLQTANAEFVRKLIAALVGSAPEVLDTLKELADALGSDPDFATTITNMIAGKQPLDNTLTNLSGKDVPALLQYLGLTEAVNRALNAVQKTGDIMTGNLFLKNDGRMHFAIANEDGNARMWLYKDKGGDGVRLNNGVDGGGEFVFGKNSEFYSPSDLHAGTAVFGGNGDVYGAAWGNVWLTAWLTSAFASRDNNINARATWDWANQNFITRVKRGEPVNPGKVNEYGPAEAPAGCVVTSVRHDPTTAYGIYFTYRPLSIFINGGWRVIEG
ncbi:hypothetical protein HZ458_004183 [Salmonella enterica]|nr:hypothetical protein [Salmonella enterica]